MRHNDGAWLLEQNLRKVFNDGHGTYESSWLWETALSLEGLTPKLVKRQHRLSPLEFEATNIADRPT